LLRSLVLGAPRLLAGERLGVVTSVQLDELMSLRFHEEASRLLRGCSLTRDLEVRVTNSRSSSFNLRKRCALNDARIAACSGSAEDCGCSSHYTASSAALASTSAT
jgi:hypothetical protein